MTRLAPGGRWVPAETREAWESYLGERLPVALQAQEVREEAPDQRFLPLEEVA